MKCKICENKCEKIFEKKILLKYDVSYHKCSNCSFIQTDEPFWHAEAYENAITSLDIGILVRNKYMVNEVSKIIDSCFTDAKKMLDYAGGYGLFVREMRDVGYDFLRQDIYCENLFANHFDIIDSNIKKFDLVTAFEVLEHFRNPIEDIESIFEYSDNVIFSTELIPTEISNIENWVYISQETGQHIAFFTKKALEIVAKKFNKNYYCKNGNLHIFTNKKLTQIQIEYFDEMFYTKEKYFGLKKRSYKKTRPIRESFQQRDYEKIKSIINSL